MAVNKDRFSLDWTAVLSGLYVVCWEPESTIA